MRVWRTYDVRWWSDQRVDEMMAEFTILIKRSETVHTKHSAHCFHKICKRKKVSQAFLASIQLAEGFTTTNNTISQIVLLVSSKNGNNK